MTTFVDLVLITVRTIFDKQLQNFGNKYNVCKHYLLFRWNLLCEDFNHIEFILDIGRDFRLVTSFHRLVGSERYTVVFVLCGSIIP